MENMCRKISPNCVRVRLVKILFCVVMALMLCLQAACSQKAVTAKESDLFAPTMAPVPESETEESAPFDAEISFSDPPLISGIGNGCKLKTVWDDSLQISYEVSSWTIFDSWEDADVEEENILRTKGASSEFEAFEEIIPEPEEGGGILLVDIVVTKLSGTAEESRMDSVLSLASAEPGANDTSYCEINSVRYFNLGDYSENEDTAEFWNYTLPHEGGSMLVTLGFIINAQTREAAENGELALIFAEPDPGEVQYEYEGDTKYLPLVVE